MTDSIIYNSSLFIAIPIAVLAGFLSFISPCVLPLLPGYLGFLGGTVGSSDGYSRRQLLLRMCLFVAGFTSVFMIIAFVAGGLGRFFLVYSDVIVRVLGVFVILLAIVFLGGFSRFQRVVRPKVQKKFSLASAPILGIALGIGWTPCIGPTLAAVTSLALSEASASKGLILGIAYSMGLGLPFILLSFGFRWITSSVGFFRKNIRLFNIIGSALLILLGILMITGLWSMFISRIGSLMTGGALL